MNLLVEDVEEFAQLLCRLDMTADQFLFCALLASDEGAGEYAVPDKQKALERFFEYYNTVAKQKEVDPWNQEALDDLEEREFVKNRNKEGEYRYDRYDPTMKFITAVFDKVDSHMDMYKEFWDAYPNEHETEDGDVLNIKSVNFEKLFDVYKDALEVEDHENILQALKLAKAKDRVNCRPDKWLNSRQWEPYLQEIEDGVDPDQESHTTLV